MPIFKLNYKQLQSLEKNNPNPEMHLKPDFVRGQHELLSNVKRAGFFGVASLRDKSSEEIKQITDQTILNQSTPEEALVAHIKAKVGPLYEKIAAYYIDAPALKLNTLIHEQLNYL